MRTEILTTLIEARRVIAAGWTQGVWEDERGCCIMGALNLACGERVDYDVYLAAWERVRAQVPGLEGRCSTLMLWNDTAGRTQAEVLEVFDRAIAQMMREREGSLAPAARERELDPA
jgi:hypothetical protein